MITLSIDIQGTVLAKHSGIGSARIVDVFDTDTLPTAYFFDSGMTSEQRKERAAYILAALAANNPDCFIEWAKNAFGEGN